MENDFWKTTMDIIARHNYDIVCPEAIRFTIEEDSDSELYEVSLRDLVFSNDKRHPKIHNKVEIVLDYNAIEYHEYDTKTFSQLVAALVFVDVSSGVIIENANAMDSYYENVKSTLSELFAYWDTVLVKDIPQRSVKDFLKRMHTDEV